MFRKVDFNLQKTYFFYVMLSVELYLLFGKIHFSLYNGSLENIERYIVKGWREGKARENNFFSYRNKEVKGEKEDCDEAIISRKA